MAEAEARVVSYMARYQRQVFAPQHRTAGEYKSPI